MVLKNGPRRRKIQVVTTSYTEACYELQELNNVAYNLEVEVRQAIENELQEKNVDPDDLEIGFIDKLVNMRIDRFDDKGNEHPKTAYQDELDKRMSDKLEEIRDIYKQKGERE